MNLVSGARANRKPWPQSLTRGDVVGLPWYLVLPQAAKWPCSSLSSRESMAFSGGAPTPEQRWVKLRGVGLEWGSSGPAYTAAPPGLA